MLLLLHPLLALFHLLLCLHQLPSLDFHDLDHPLVLLVSDAAALSTQEVHAEAVDFCLGLREEPLEVLQARVAQGGLQVVQSFLGT